MMFQPSTFEQQGVRSVRFGLACTFWVQSSIRYSCWGVLALLSSFCAAAPLVPPLLQKVGQTISSTTERGFVCLWRDTTVDEDLFEIRVRVGTAGPFTAVNYVLNNAQFGTWYATNRYLANVPEGAKLQFQIVALHATLVRDQTTNQITDFTVTERSLPSNTMTLDYTKLTTDGDLRAPTGFTAELIGDGKIKLKWSENSQVEDGFSFFVKKTTDTAYPAAEAFSIPFNITEFTIPAYSVQRGTDLYGLLPGVAYHLKMRSVQGETKQSAFTSEVTLTMPPMTAPTGLTLTPVNETSLFLNWNDNTDNEHGYVIQLPIGDPFGDITWDSVQANVNTYLLQNLVPGTTAKWKVTAGFNPGSGGDLLLSAPSNVVEFTNVMKPPLKLQAVVTDDLVQGKTRVALTWEDQSSAETHIAIMMRPAGTTGAFTMAAKVPANSTSAVLYDELPPGGNYELAVRSVYIGESGSVAGESVDSNAVPVQVHHGFSGRRYQPAAVGTSFTYQAVTTGSANRVSWSATGLPTGLGFDESTGMISGIPTESGIFDIMLNAVFDDGWVAHHPLRLRIVRSPAAPLVTAATAARTMNVGTPISVALDGFFNDADTEQAMRIVTTLGNIDIVLYPSLVPATVANFLAYANAGDYNGTVFHRVSPGFVLQGGGYKVLTAPDTFAEVTRRPSPLNEPGISNLKGTLALAKGSGVSSGTHDFFINTADNTSLDDNTGGFSVFGRVARRQLTPGGLDQTVADITGSPGKKYTVKVRPSGSTEVQNGFNPLAGLGDAEFWPLNLVGTPPDAIDVTKVIAITSITPLPKLAYNIETPPDSNIATAAISSGNLSLTGVASGNTNVIIRATDVDGQSITRSFALTVDSGFAHPVITTPPQAVTVSQNGTANFTVVATGTSLTYQWRKDGQPINGEVAATLTISSAQALDAGSYDVLVSNAATSVISAAAALTVQSPPFVVTPPVAITRPYGGSATFTVSATGSPTLSYAWFKANSLLASATTATLTLNSLTLVDGADYKVRVTNGFGFVESTPVRLTITRVDTDSDGLLDDQEVILTLNKSHPDTDGDGFTDGVEVHLGSDARQAASKPTHSVAEHDGLALLGSIGLKRLIGGTSTDSTGAPSTVVAQWLATTELTNAQFAAVLQYAVHTLQAAEIVSDSGRRFVRYPKTTGQAICYLSDSVASPPASDITADPAGRSFLVPAAKATQPVRAVSWYGAYLATVVLNARHGYLDKCVPATWSYLELANGYSLPTFATWGWAAQGGAAALAYPTGASVSPALAKYFDSALGATPRPVGSYPLSKLGFADLAGNVSEWVTDGDTANSYTRGGGYDDSAVALINSAAVLRPKSLLNRSTGFRAALKASAAPAITQQPAPVMVRNGQPISLSVSATGAPALAYQWFKNEVALTGKTAATLSLANAVLDDGGAYKVKVTSQGVSLFSSTVAVAVVEAPLPVSTTYVAPNKGTKFIVKVKGAPGQQFKYRWGSSFSTLSNTYFMHGVDTPVLDIVTAQQGLSDSYFCEVRAVGLNAVPPVSVGYQLVVYDLPALTVPTRLPYGVVTSDYNYQVPYDTTSDERRITRWLATGLPAGFSINTLTGVITGAATGPVSANVKITGVNPYGSVTSSVSLVIRGLPGSMVGSYVATVARHSLNAQHGGRLDLTASSTGALTGKLIIDGLGHSITGKLTATVNATTGEVAATANATIDIPRSNLPTLRLVVTLDSANDALTGTLGELGPGGGAPVTTAALTGWRAASIVSERIGRHHVALAPAVASTDPASAPQGYSTVVLTVTNTGTTSAVATLADGTTFTSSGLLGPNQTILHSSLYQRRGAVLGVLRIAGDADHTISIGAGEHLDWVRDDLGATSTERSYKRGFDLRLTVAAGAEYVIPAATAVPLALTDVADNARLRLTSGGLAAPVEPLLRLRTDWTALISGSNVEAVGVQLTRTTGVFKGSFKVADITPPRTITFTGLILPDPALPARGKGFGFFSLPQVLPSLVTSPILSGRVVLESVVP
jgi:cyclophilin family peptidyl-prolyl cis-trans isomerase/formylglycine-generating enzyme required for sulfatase activity